jgi:hypothetical protein
MQPVSLEFVNLREKAPMACFSKKTKHFLYFLSGLGRGWASTRISLPRCRTHDPWFLDPPTYSHCSTLARARLVESKQKPKRTPARKWQGTRKLNQGNVGSHWSVGPECYRVHVSMRWQLEFGRRAVDPVHGTGGRAEAKERFRSLNGHTLVVQWWDLVSVTNAPSLDLNQYVAPFYIRIDTKMIPYFFFL